MTEKTSFDRYTAELEKLAAAGQLRTLPENAPSGKWIICENERLLNLSSNDYLGLAADEALREEFLTRTPLASLPFSSSSSRLLTGNFPEYTRLETLLASLYGTENALVFSSGYHMNTGILPALCNRRTLILADKLVHASLIDGIRLSGAHCIRYRHQDYAQLETLLEKHDRDWERIVIVTESIFSMDGDVADLRRMTELKRRFPHTMLYVDEAHAVGARGQRGLGIAEEQGCLEEIDLLCGTFGKALASVGAFTVCSGILRDWLVNRMRTLIFTTALPSVNIAWTRFILERLSEFQERRQRLTRSASLLRDAFRDRGLEMPSESHIVPMIVGSNADTVRMAETMRHRGFYVLPIRPPTVPAGTSRLRFSLTAALTENDIIRLTESL